MPNLLHLSVKRYSWTVRSSKTIGQFPSKLIARLVSDQTMSFLDQAVEPVDKPWKTDRFKNLIKKRQHAWKKGNKTLYKFYKNKVNQAVNRLIKPKFYREKCDGRAKSNPRNWVPQKVFWCSTTTVPVTYHT